MNEKIAILAWGSLIHNPGILSNIIDDWKPDGPMLPIEFARGSNDGRLTLVIYNEYMNLKERWVKTQWCLSNTTVNDSKTILAQREKCSINKIGACYPGKDFKVKDVVQNSINDWALRKGIDVVVIWTNLPATFNSEEGILSYLLDLKDEALIKTKAYVFSAPLQTMTYLRKEITKILSTKL